MEEKNLLALERYLKTGSHIGTRFKTGDMQRYIFKVRKDALKVLDVETIDARLKIAAKFLDNYELPRIVAVSRKTYGHNAVKKFAEATGAKAMVGTSGGGFGLPIIESMSCGVPNLTDDYAAGKELIEDSGAGILIKSATPIFRGALQA